MSEQNNSNQSKKLVFYVDEDADDFTFYLARDKENTVVKGLLGDRLEQVESQKAKMVENQTFTFSEEVIVKSLFLTKDSLKDEASFWQKLKNPMNNTPHFYLRKKLEEELKSTQNDNGKLKTSLNAFKKGSRDRETKKTLSLAIVRVLNDAIRGDSLKSQSWVKDELLRREAALINALPNKTKTKWCNRVFLQGAFSDLIKETQLGRGLICFSYVGRYLSVTFRKLTAGGGYAPQTDTDRSKYLFSVAEYCELIYKEVFERTDSTEYAHGLLVVTGATKSAKSEIARALIHLYLTRKKNKKRRPHLVTFEDPVEKFYSSEKRKGLYAWKALERSTKASVIDYTPRQKGKDVALLKEALTDALRQTPATFFVGETRDKEEWELLLDFAATGHLIVTTAHAGSLVEAMHKIFEARKVKTPADRSEIANKLFGLIHLRMGNIEINEEGKTAEALFPALWRRTERGLASLTSDGLASLLPHRSSEVKNGGPSCLGRRWLTDCLIRSAAADLSETFANFEEPFDKSLKLRLYKRATEWDLEGV